ncbi:LysR family transcriptional regulator [Roseobacter sp. YSTF-M11]|uniref:LysR family transcriptional regulator n=1 Tax=Roseobacter insulae TaxID=2859783 RepID=A0A9X1FZX5_9RHOB|nr:LysR family transcriptional regulator [Roseobacter insulae]MBW4710492.1 LysR family transcriptional regulator [Roseobacter insulae]
MKFGLRHIRYFIAVAEEQHFRRAAERLGVAQPALSRAIQYLEKELGVVLFTRSNRNVQITPAGESFLAGCRGVINSIDHAVDNTRLAHRGLLGSLRIGYTDMAIAGCLPVLLKAFQDGHPNIILQPHHDVTVTQLQKLDTGALDIGFVTGPINRTGYRQCPVQSERFVCVVYESHPLAGRAAIRLEELAGEDFVHGSSKDWEQFHSYLLPLCRRSGFVPQVVQEAFNTAGILGLVSAGMGVTILTESVLNAIGPGLVAIPIEDASERLQTVAFWKRDAPDGAMQLFVDFLQDYELSAD